MEITTFGPHCICFGVAVVVVYLFLLLFTSGHYKTVADDYDFCALLFVTWRHPHACAGSLLVQRSQHNSAKHGVTMTFILSYRIVAGRHHVSCNVVNLITMHTHNFSCLITRIQAYTVTAKPWRTMSFRQICVLMRRSLFLSSRSIVYHTIWRLAK